jgi:hypothetical protein
MKTTAKDHYSLLLMIVLIMNMACTTNAQTTMKHFIINDEVVDTAVIHQLERAYRVQFVPGNYWYDNLTGAFGVKGGPCTGIGIAGLVIGGPLKANASGGGTAFFINGRALHPLDVAGLQTFMQPVPGRYWMDAHGNFGYENYPAVMGNIYLLYKAKFANGGKKSSYYKNNVWSGETTSFGGDGTFMYYSSKKTDGTTYEYNN